MSFVHFFVEYEYERDPLVFHLSLEARVEGLFESKCVCVYVSIKVMLCMCELGDSANTQTLVCFLHSPFLSKLSIVVMYRLSHSFQSLYCAT